MIELSSRHVAGFTHPPSRSRGPELHEGIEYVGELLDLPIVGDRPPQQAFTCVDLSRLFAGCTQLLVQC